MMGNRLHRRVMRAEAEVLARKLARACKGYGATAEACRMVEDHRAVRALERAFAMLLRRGGSPYVVRLDEETARSFPGAVPAGQAEGARPWLAVGLDGAGAASYAVRFVAVPGVGPAEEAQVAEAVMLQAIQPHLAMLGFPSAAGWA